MARNILKAEQAHNVLDLLEDVKTDLLEEIRFRPEGNEYASAQLVTVDECITQLRNAILDDTRQESTVA